MEHWDGGSRQNVLNFQIAFLLDENTLLDRITLLNGTTFLDGILQVFSAKTLRILAKFPHFTSQLLLS